MVSRIFILVRKCSTLSTKNYLGFSILTLIICCSVVTLGFIPPATSQNSTDSIEKIGYTHQKTPINGFLMHYVIGGKGDPVVLLHGWPETW
jgi:hypothetical protein